MVHFKSPEEIKIREMFREGFLKAGTETGKTIEKMSQQVANIHRV